MSSVKCCMQIHLQMSSDSPRHRQKFLTIEFDGLRNTPLIWKKWDKVYVF